MSHPRRLLQLVDFDLPYASSFIPMLRGVLEAAKERGWEAELVLFEAARDRKWLAEFERAGITVIFAPEGARRKYIRLGRWLTGELERRPGPAVLHTHFHGFDIAALLAARRRLDTKVVWHVHSAFPTGVIRVATSTLKFGLLGRTVSAILCPSTNIVESTRRRLAPRSRVEFVPSSIDVQSFPVASRDDRDRARAELGLPTVATVLLHFGWHWKLKGGDLFLLTAKQLIDAGREDLIAVERGGGDEYLAYASRLGIAEHVRIQAPVEKVQTLHAAADVLVSSSRNEGMAYAVLESLCMGIPVVATDIPGHTFIGRETDACRITSGDPGDLARAVDTVLERPESQATAESAAGRDWVARNLGLETVANQLVDRYEAIVGSSTAGRPSSA